MFSSPQRKLSFSKKAPGQSVDSVGIRRRGVTDLVNVYDFQKDPARTQGDLGPLPTGLPIIDAAEGQLTVSRGATIPTGTTKYLTRDISAIVGDWEFTILCKRILVEFGITVTDAAGTKSVSIVQRSSSPNNAIQRQTNNTTTATPVTFADNNIYQTATHIYYNVRKVGTNILFYTSADGTTFTLRHTEALATHLITADRIGFYVGVGAGQGVGEILWFVQNFLGTDYTDYFDDRSLDADWVWYNGDATETAVEVDRFIEFFDDTLPLTLTFEDTQYGNDPPQSRVSNNSDTLNHSVTFDFQYSVSVALPDPYGNEDTLAFTPTFSFTYA